MQSLTFQCRTLGAGGAWVAGGSEAKSKPLARATKSARKRGKQQSEYVSRANFEKEYHRVYHFLGLPQDLLEIDGRCCSLPIVGYLQRRVWCFTCARFEILIILKIILIVPDSRNAELIVLFRVGFGIIGVLAFFSFDRADEIEEINLDFRQSFASDRHRGFSFCDLLSEFVKR